VKYSASECSGVGTASANPGPRSRASSAEEDPRAYGEREIVVAATHEVTAEQCVCLVFVSTSIGRFSAPLGAALRTREALHLDDEIANR
jgi:hypothetical protein